MIRTEQTSEPLNESAGMRISPRAGGRIKSGRGFAQLSDSALNACWISTTWKRALDYESTTLEVVCYLGWLLKKRYRPDNERPVV
jgi:hypothetical protein